MCGVSAAARPRTPRLAATLRDKESVTPLELFFDLVFVLALTQCTALMADEPTWEGAREGDARARGAVVVVERLRVADEPRRPRGGRRPDRDVRRDGAPSCRRAVRARGVRRLGAAVRARLRRRADRAHRAVRDRQPRRPEPAHVGDRRSRSAPRSASACSSGASFADGALQGAIWGVAILLDYGGPYFFGVEGWRMMPEPLRRALRADRDHRARRVDRRDRRRRRVGGRRRDRRRRGARHDRRRRAVVAVLRRRRARRRAAAAQAAPGRERNSIGRDSYGYLHLPMVAGIVLLALGLKKTLGHVEDPLKLVPAVALLGGTAMYLLAHVAFRLRNVHRFSAQRLLCALVLVALIPARGRARRRSRRSRSRRAARGADRLREHPLRRAARPPAPPGGAGALITGRRPPPTRSTSTPAP